MEGLPKGTVTFLFTDIEGSSARWEQDGEEMRAALARHDAMLRGVVTARDGFVVKHTGDGLMAVFEDASGAVAAAVDAQRAVEGVAVRIGIHTGPAEPDAVGDYLGLTPTRAARVMGAAHGGQVLVSGPTAALAMERLPAGVDLVDMGEHRMRNLARLERLWQVRHPALRAEFPPPRVAASAVLGNVPALRSEVVGRQEEIALALGLLDERRLVTLTGPGGVGKTTVALAVAARFRARDGAWFVDLVPLSGGGEVLAAVAGGLDVRQRDGLSLQQSVLDGLSTSELLVVVDNCEHVLEEVAGLVDLLLGAAPGVRVLATSREALGVPGEQLVPLGALATGAGGAATQLFLDRARTVQPQLQLSADDLEVVDGICAQLDGLPLAIELAAARVRSLAPPELAARLGDRLRLLRTTGRPSGSRHDTLEATIAWSYELLDGSQRDLFQRLAVFPAAFDVPAAAAVAAGVVADEDDALDELDRLAARSLLVVEGSERFRLLVTVRAFAHARLAAAGLTDHVTAAHARYFRDLAARLGPRVLDEPATEAIDRLDGEYANLDHALDWLTEHDPDAALDMATDLSHFSFHRGHAADTERRLLGLLPRLPALDEVRRSKALLVAGGGRFLRGDTKGAGLLWQQGLQDLPVEEPEASLGRALLAQVVLFDGDVDAARQLLDDALAAVDPDSHPYYPMSISAVAASLLAWMGDLDGAQRNVDAALRAAAGVSPAAASPYATSMGVALRRLDPPRSVQLLEDALARPTVSRDPYSEAVITMHLGFSLLVARRTADGCRALSTSLPLLLRTGTRRDAFQALEALAEGLGREGASEAAAVALSAAGRLRDELGIVGLPGELERRHRLGASLRDRLGDERFDTSTNEARRAGLDEICELMAEVVDHLGP